MCGSLAATVMLNGLAPLILLWLIDCPNFGIWEIQASGVRPEAGGKAGALKTVVTSIHWLPRYTKNLRPEASRYVKV